MNLKIHNFNRQFCSWIKKDVGWSSNLQNILLLSQFSTTKQQIKLWVSKPLSTNLFYKTKHQQKIILNVLITFRFLWRYAWTYTLFLLYLRLLTYKEKRQSVKLLTNYYQFQFRLLFSKLDQKFFLRLIIQWNKFILTFCKNNNLLWLNKLHFFQIIITGRWQRKRWVNPFPKFTVYII